MNSANSTVLQLEQVWKDYQQALKTFLHSKVNNSADVDDLLQEILIKTYQSLNTVQDADSVKAWLFQLANRTIIDFYRKRARQQRDHELDAQDLSKCIEPFIQALPEQNASLLFAIDIKGQSQKALAQQQNIRYSTMKSRVQKSRNELKKLFEECCHLSLDSHGNVIDCDSKSGNGCEKC